MSRRKIIVNSGWLVGDQVFRLAAGLFIGAWVARYLGPEQYGIMSYAIAFSSLFSAIASLGIDSIVIRDLVREPETRGKLLGTAFILKFIGGIITLTLALFGIWIVRPGETLILSLVGLSSIGFVFQAVGVIDLHFQSITENKATVLSRSIAFTLISIVKVCLLIFRYPLLAFGIASALEIFIYSVFLIFAYRYQGDNILDWSFDRHIAIRVCKDSWPLLLSGIAIGIYMRIDQIIIGIFLDDRTVGIYSGAVRISELWYFLPMAISASVFPRIIQLKDSNPHAFQARSEEYIRFMALFGLLVAIIISLFNTQVVELIFGQQYVESAVILQYHAWAGVFVCIGIASGSMLLAMNLQKVSFYRCFFGAITSICLNLLFIPLFGAKGAAFSSVVSYAFSVFSIYFFSETMIVRKTISRALIPVFSGK